MLLQYSALLAGLIAGSVTDLKTREVPDWLNYSLIASGFGLNILASILLNDHRIILFSIIGFALFFGISHIMYYTGQWGGGDAKMLMGIGALLGLGVTYSFPYFDGKSILISFLANLLIAGFFYGICAAIFIAIINRKKFLNQLKKDLERLRTLRIIVLTLSLIILLSSFFIKNFHLKIGLAAFGTLIAATFYLWIAVKTVENACMYKLVKPEKLTEGDWIAKDIVIGKKKIAGPGDLGIEKKQIAELLKLAKKGKVKKVMIKEGIPFVPSFLLAFLMSLLWGNVLFYFI